MMMLTTLTTAVTIAGPAAPVAQAAPLSQTPITSNNMQGADEGAKWSKPTRDYVQDSDVVLLQEAGPTPPSNSEFVENIEWDSQRPGRAGYVQHHTWRLDTERNDPNEYHVYFLQTDRNGGRWEGGRNNLAIVTRRPADEVEVIRNYHTADEARPVLGVRLGDTWYFTIHALSGGGADAANMVRDIEAWMRNVHGGQHFVIGGDFNVDPDVLRGRENYPVGRVRRYTTGLATHQNGGEYDYFITDNGSIARQRANRRDGSSPDHYAVGIGPFRSEHTSTRIDLMPTGDTVAWEPVEFADPRRSTGQFTMTSMSDYRYRYIGQGGSGGLTRRGAGPAALADEEVPLTPSLDMVGTQRHGDIPDPDHEGYSDHEIDQVAERVDDTVPQLRPNVVMLMAGTEDMENDTDVAGAPDRLGRLIDQILEDSPRAAVLVATLPPAADPAIQARIEAFNQRVPDVVAQRRSAGKHVALVLMNHLTTADLSGDGLHPNEAGHEKMATAFVDGIVGAFFAGWIPAETGTETGETADVLRTMGLGSSTTFGERSPDGNGYRDKLDEELRELFDPSPRPAPAEPLVDWVGSVRVGTMADRDIEGWPGLRIDQIADKARCAVKTYQPNLITLTAGGNDVVQNYQMGTAIERLEDLIEQVITDSPGVTVLVSGLQPFHDAARNARSEAFSAQVPGLVDRLVARGRHVVYADITGMEASDIVTIDGIHPNGQGYHKIAAAFAAAAAEAKAKNWIRKANPQAPNAANHPCGLEDHGDGTETGESNPNKLGQHWEDRGVIQKEQFSSTSRFWMVDINKDRKAEFVVVDKDQKFQFWWNGGPSGTNWVPFTPGQNSYTPKAGAVGNMLRFGDVDGDGFPDCMVVFLNGVIDLHTWKADNPSGQRMCMNKYDGKAHVFSNGSTGNRLPIASDTKIRFADVTGGGRDDYLLIRPDGSVKAWYNKGLQVEDGRKFLEWEVPQNISGPLAAPREIRYADINGDRRADRILITAKGGARAWINEGPGGSGGTYRDIGKIAEDAEVPPKDVQFADVDGDGKADFLRIGWTGVMHAWLNKLPANYFATFHP
ncbi:GDSL-type esterase/lipase family protein [Spongiactinospora sp. 9N601]|uniref:GDSL-type esterase/lipase family protein n=1 Tax=Spongiactinospora sp. 9N601 TaxID=3375149 RepID=UPI0037BC83D1